ncbi:MAG: hypothetical protein JO102_06695, partial [Elusimicrobia bacterium]|nr:hypothetical protein [Elusimicrobiota bacterium]
MTFQQALTRLRGQGDEGNRIADALVARYGENGGGARVQVLTNLRGDLFVQINGGNRGTSTVTFDVAGAAPTMIVHQQAHDNQNAREQAQMDQRGAAQQAGILRQGFVTVDGQRVAVQWDGANRQIVPAPGQGRIRVQMLNTEGHWVTVQVDVHHFEIQNGQVVVKGSAHIAGGQEFLDGRVGVNNDAAGGAGRPGGGTISRNLDVTVRDDGNVIFRARAGGGEVAISAAIGADGNAHFGHESFQPVTAGSENIRILDGRGNVLAQSGAAGHVDGVGGQRFTYSNWTVTAGADRAMANGANILQHFQVGADNHTLVDSRGFAVGRVTLGAAGQLQGVILNTTSQGQAAATALLGARARPGDALAAVPIMMEGRQGRALITLNAGADPSRVAGALGQMEAFHANGHTGAQIDAAFMQIVAATPGIQRYQVSTQVDWGGRPVNILISGRGDVNGHVAPPAVTSEQAGVVRSLYAGSPRALVAPGHLTDIGIGIDARITGGDVRHAVDPATGQHRFSGDGQLRFQTQEGMSGTVTIRGGRVAGLAFDGGAAGGVFNVAGAPGEAPAMRLHVEAGATPGFNFETGEVTGRLGTFRVEDVRRGLTVDLTRNAANNRIEARMAGAPNFQAFGQRIDAAAVTSVSFEGGSLRFELSRSIDINAPIRFGDTAANPNAQVNHASITTLTLDIFSGNMTGHGRSALNAGQEVFIPESRGGGRGINAGGDSDNLVVRRVAGGQIVRPARDDERLPGVDGPAYLNVAVQETPGAGGAYSGQANVLTRGSRNIRTEGEGVELGGQTYNGRFVIDNPPPAPGTTARTQTVTALESGTIRNANGDETVVRVPPGGAPVPLRYVDGRLQMDASLVNVSLRINGTDFGFRQEEGPARPGEVGPRPMVIVPVVLSDSVTAFGRQIPRDQVRNLRMEDGRITFDLATPLRITPPQGFRFQADGVAQQDVVRGRAVDVHRVTIDPGTGVISARVTTGVDGPMRVIRERGGSSAPGTRTPTLDPAAMAGRDIGVEDNEDGTSTITPLEGAGNTPRLAMTLVDDRRGGPLSAQANITPDQAQNIRAVGRGADFFGTHWTAGTRVDVGLAAAGNYNITTPDGAVGTRTIREEGRPDRVETITSTRGGVIPFRGGVMVTRPQGARAAPTDAVDGLAAVTPTGRHVVSGGAARVEERGPDGRMRPVAGIEQMGPAQQSVVVVENGVVASMQGTQFRNVTGNDVVLSAREESATNPNPSRVVVESGTNFIYTGLSILGGAQYRVLESVRPMGGIRLETRIRADESAGPALHGRRVSEWVVQRIDAAPDGGSTTATFYERREVTPGAPWGGRLVSSSIMELSGPGGGLRYNHETNSFEVVGADGRASRSGSFTFRGVTYDLQERPDENGRVPATPTQGVAIVARPASLAEVAGRPDAMVLDANGGLHTGRITAVAATTGPQGHSAYYHMDLSRPELAYVAENGDHVEIRAIKFGLSANGSPPNTMVPMYDYVLTNGAGETRNLVQDHMGMRFVASLGATPGATVHGDFAFDGGTIRSQAIGDSTRIETIFSAEVARRGVTFLRNEPALRTAVRNAETRLTAAQRALAADPRNETLVTNERNAQRDVREARQNLDAAAAPSFRFAVNSDRIRMGTVTFVPSGRVTVSGVWSHGGTATEHIDIGAESLIAIREQGTNVYTLTSAQRSPSDTFTIAERSEFAWPTYGSRLEFRSGALRAERDGDAIQIGGGTGDEQYEYIAMARGGRGPSGDRPPTVLQTRRRVTEGYYYLVEVTRGEVQISHNSLGVAPGTVLVDTGIDNVLDPRRVTVVRAADPSRPWENTGRAYGALQIDVTRTGFDAANGRNLYDSGQVQGAMAARFGRDTRIGRGALREGPGGQSTIVILDSEFRLVGDATLKQEAISRLGIGTTGLGDNGQRRLSEVNLDFWGAATDSNPRGHYQAHQQENRRGFDICPEVQEGQRTYEGQQASRPFQVTDANGDQQTVRGRYNDRITVFS